MQRRKKVESYDDEAVGSDAPSRTGSGLPTEAGGNGGAGLRGAGTHTSLAAPAASHPHQAPGGAPYGVAAAPTAPSGLPVTAARHQQPGAAATAGPGLGAFAHQPAAGVGLRGAGGGSLPPDAGQPRQQLGAATVRQGLLQSRPTASTSAAPTAAAATGTSGAGAAMGRAPAVAGHRPQKAAAARPATAQAAPSAAVQAGPEPPVPKASPAAPDSSNPSTSSSLSSSPRARLARAVAAQLYSAAQQLPAADAPALLPDQRPGQPIVRAPVIAAAQRGVQRDAPPAAVRVSQPAASADRGLQRPGQEHPGAAAPITGPAEGLGSRGSQLDTPLSPPPSSTTASEAGHASAGQPLMQQAAAPPSHSPASASSKALPKSAAAPSTEQGTLGRGGGSGAHGSFSPTAAAAGSRPQPVANPARPAAVASMGSSNTALRNPPEPVSPKATHPAPAAAANSRPQPVASPAQPAALGRGSSVSATSPKTAQAAASPAAPQAAAAEAPAARMVVAEAPRPPAGAAAAPAPAPAAPQPAAAAEAAESPPQSPPRPGHEAFGSLLTLAPSAGDELAASPPASSPAATAVEATVPGAAPAPAQALPSYEDIPKRVESADLPSPFQGSNSAAADGAAAAGAAGATGVPAVDPSPVSAAPSSEVQPLGSLGPSPAAALPFLSPVGTGLISEVATATATKQAGSDSKRDRTAVGHEQLQEAHGVAATASTAPQQVVPVAEAAPLSPMPADELEAAVGGGEASQEGQQGQQQQEEEVATEPVVVTTFAVAGGVPMFGLGGGEEEGEEDAFLFGGPQAEGAAGFGGEDDWMLQEPPLSGTTLGPSKTSHSTSSTPPAQPPAQLASLPASTAATAAAVPQVLATPWEAPAAATEQQPLNDLASSFGLEAAPAPWEEQQQETAAPQVVGAEAGQQAAAWQQSQQGWAQEAAPWEAQQADGEAFFAELASAEQPGWGAAPTEAQAAQQGWDVTPEAAQQGWGEAPAKQAVQEGWAEPAGSLQGWGAVPSEQAAQQQGWEALSSEQQQGWCKTTPEQGYGEQVAQQQEWEQAPADQQQWWGQAPAGLEGGWEQLAAAGPQHLEQQQQESKLATSYADGEATAWQQPPSAAQGEEQAAGTEAAGEGPAGAAVAPAAYQAGQPPVQEGVSAGSEAPEAAAGPWAGGELAASASMPFWEGAVAAQPQLGQEQEAWALAPELAGEGAGAGGEALAEEATLWEASLEPNSALPREQQLGQQAEAVREAAEGLGATAGLGANSGAAAAAVAPRDVPEGEGLQGAAAAAVGQALALPPAETAAAEPAATAAGVANGDLGGGEGAWAALPGQEGYAAGGEPFPGEAAEESWDLESPKVSMQEPTAALAEGEAAAAASAAAAGQGAQEGTTWWGEDGYCYFDSPDGWRYYWDDSTHQWAQYMQIGQPAAEAAPVLQGPAVSQGAGGEEAAGAAAGATAGMVAAEAVSQEQPAAAKHVPVEGSGGVEATLPGQQLLGQAAAPEQLQWQQEGDALAVPPEQVPWAHMGEQGPVLGGEQAAQEPHPAAFHPSAPAGQPQASGWAAPTVFQPSATAAAPAPAATQPASQGYFAQQAQQQWAQQAPLAHAGPVLAAASFCAAPSTHSAAATAAVPGYGAAPAMYGAAALPAAAAVDYNDPTRTHWRPAACFGQLTFGGRLLMVMPSGQLSLHPMDRLPDYVLRPLGGARGTASLSELRGLASGFPGPLSSSTPKDKVAKFVGERMEACASEEPFCRDPAALQTLWAVLRVLAQFQGSIKSVPYSRLKPSDEASSPEAALASALLDPFGAATSSAGIAVGTPAPAADAALLAPANGAVAAARVQELLLMGRRSEALSAALESQLWGIALLVARLIGEAAVAETGAAMAEHCLAAGAPLRTLCTLLAQAGDQGTAGPGTLAQPSPGRGGTGLGGTAAVGASGGEAQEGGLLAGDWRQQLAIVAANRTPGDERAMERLGEHLLRVKGQALAAHVCFCLAGLPLLPADAPLPALVTVGADLASAFRTYTSLPAILRTEVYAWAQTAGNSALASHYAGVLPYKLLHAAQLVELGVLPQAAQYCHNVLSTLQGMGKVPPGLLVCKAVAADLQDRLQAYASANKIGLGRSFSAGTLVSSMGKWLDRGITALMGGGTSDGAGSGPASRSGPAYSSGLNLAGMVEGAKLGHSRSQSFSNAADSPKVALASGPPSTSSYFAPGKPPLPRSTGNTPPASTRGGLLLAPTPQAQQQQPGPTPQGGQQGQGVTAAVPPAEQAPRSIGRGMIRALGSFTALMGSASKSKEEAKASPAPAAPSEPENVFYYDSELKMWREKGAPPPVQSASPPPPPTTGAAWQVQAAQLQQGGSGLAPPPMGSAALSLPRGGVASRYVNTLPGAAIAASAAPAMAAQPSLLPAAAGAAWGGASPAMPPGGGALPAGAGGDLLQPAPTTGGTSHSSMEGPSPATVLGQQPGMPAMPSMPSVTSPPPSLQPLRIPSGPSSSVASPTAGGLVPGTKFIYTPPAAAPPAMLPMPPGGLPAAAAVPRPFAGAAPLALVPAIGGVPGGGEAAPTWAMPQHGCAQVPPSGQALHEVPSTAVLPVVGGDADAAESSPMAGPQAPLGAANYAAAGYSAEAAAGHEGWVGYGEGYALQQQDGSGWGQANGQAAGAGDWLGYGSQEGQQGWGSAYGYGNDAVAQQGVGGGHEGAGPAAEGQAMAGVSLDELTEVAL